MSPKLIILVENDANLCQSIALILQRAGYIVTATDCVYKALEIVPTANYNLLISDVNIPETTNVLLPKIHTDYPHLPVVILTDQSSAEADRESKQYGAHFLVKPVAPERLLDSVGSIMRNKNHTNQINNHGLPVERF